MAIRTPCQRKRREGLKGDDWPDGRVGGGPVQGWCFKVGSCPLQLLGQWGELWEAAQGSPATGISPTAPYHLPEVLPPSHKPCFAISGIFGIGFLLLEEGKRNNCRVMGTPHLVQQELFLNVAGHGVPDGCSL